MASMKIYIPEDLCRDILVRLPVKSLLRFTSVCKLWKQIINSKSFCKLHLDHNKSSSNTKNHILFNHRYICTPDIIDTESCVDVESSDRWSCLSIDQRKDQVYGICNGLLCFSDQDFSLNSVIYLWNPFARRGKKLPRASGGEYTAASFRAHARLAFGYHDDDYKVIRTVRYRETYIIHIYSLKSDQWEFLYLNVPNNIANEIHYNIKCIQYSHAMLVNGLVYFEYRKARQLVCIDIGYKNMEVVDFPEQVNAHSLDIMKAYGESIALLNFEWMGGINSEMVMWILNLSSRGKFSWEKRLIVHHMSRCYPILGLRNDSKVMVRMNNPYQYMLFDLENNRFKQLKFRQHFATSEERIVVRKMDSFVESLVLLDESTKCRYIMKEFASVNTASNIYILL